MTALERAYAAADAASSCVTPPAGVAHAAWLYEHRDLAYRRGMVHAGLVGALTDPDDPDWLARRLFEHDVAIGTSKIEPRAWPPVSPWEREMYQERAAAVRAAILGGAS